MLWEELLCRESCKLIPVVPVFCVCVFIPGHSGSGSNRVDFTPGPYASCFLMQFSRGTELTMPKS